MKRYSAPLVIEDASSSNEKTLILGIRKQVCPAERFTSLLNSFLWFQIRALGIQRVEQLICVSKVRFRRVTGYENDKSCRDQ
ncbi:hypothetical protein L1987_64365 [Smallanthus sonchifolius]|uniref:Uncharacterized protein n=1 Tax=Smallanthus sonchifolius TaxID=185202 RepID=A0ACB9CFV7_9ASTR|nr:hypothetical protein L1987_64365 [Smallanthus sonchifolius]